jgi:hypothetical protein
VPWFALFIFVVGYFIVLGYERDWHRVRKYTFTKRGLGPPPAGFMPTDRQYHP